MSKRYRAICVLIGLLIGTGLCLIGYLSGISQVP